MSNYTKTTDFEAKDSLPTGDSGKIIRGSEFETEFDAISTAIATKADTAGPTFTGTLTFETISDGTINVTAFVDEDNMSSNSATLVPTQQSVKAYVDSVTTELQAQDLDFQADSGGALSIDLDTETMTFTGGTGIDTSGSGNAVTFAIDSTVTTLTGTQTLTNKTLTTPVISSISNTGTLTLPTSTDTLVGRATTDTLTNKTLTSPVISTISNTGTITLPTSTDTLVGRATTDTLTNKTLTSAVLNTGVSGTAVLDEDNMASNSATQLATQQSIKAYVDATVAATNEVVEDTTPQLGGNLDTNGSDILFADNDKAVFGAGSDLQIYHTGSVSVIEDSGTGNLLIRGTDMRLQNAAGDNNYLKAIDGAEVELMYGGATKLATTNTGINVTGTVTADGLTVEGTNGNFEVATTGNSVNMTRAGNNFITASDSSGDLYLGAGGASFLKIDNGGDISFYEDTSTTAKLFWDASAERLGIGTSSPSDELTIRGAQFNTTTVSIGDNSDRLRLGYLHSGGLTSSTAAGQIGTTSSSQLDLAAPSNAASTMRFFTNASSGAPTERMRIDSSGQLGIGTTSPSSELHVKSSDSEVALNLEATTARLKINTNNFISATSSVTTFGVNGTEAMRLNSSGQLGIGTTSPSRLLNVVGTDTIVSQFENTTATGNARIYVTAGTANGILSQYGQSHATLANVTQLSSPSETRFVNGGVTIATMKSSGNVGIGTSTPANTVHVKTDTDGNGITIQRNSTTENTYGQLAFSASTNDTGTPNLWIRGYRGSSFTENYLTFGTGSTTGIERMRIDSSGNILAGTDDAQDIGSGSKRFDDIHATNGTIQTSDRNEKQDIEELSDAEQRVAVACKGLLRKFRWKSAVAEKGNDARIHFGIIAQDLQDAFTAEGLDAGRYAMFISTTWTDEETGEERTRMGVRYSELLAFIIAAI